MEAQVERELEKQLEHKHHEEILRGRDYAPREGLPYVPNKSDPVLSSLAMRSLKMAFWAECVVPSYTAQAFARLKARRVRHMKSKKLRKVYVNKVDNAPPEPEPPVPTQQEEQVTGNEEP
jgi:hypothetical protein